MIPFVKTHALGNDFILVESTAAVPADCAAFARRICDRYFGIGGDGLILWHPGSDGFAIRIFNQDGSEAECSGNGLRCVAAYLTQSGRWPKNEIRLQTVSGVYALRRVGNEYEADMGEPKLSPQDIPFKPEPLHAGIDRVVNYPLRVNESTFAVTACSTGNPHCSLFVDKVDDTVVRTTGPLLETHPAFPNRTNVEFIHVLNNSEIEVRFWERGVGYSNASGTGSCGAVVASILNGKTGRRVTVHAKAGRLVVEWPEGGRLKLTSTANIVAEGNYLEA
jgi:diaminopimelate epimerase